MLRGSNSLFCLCTVLVADTLADGSSNGETLTMPSSVARCSPSALTGKMTTLLRSRVIDNVDTTEPVVSVVAAVFHVCSAETAALDAGLGGHLSPQVSRSLARAVCRWTCSYMFPDLSCYEQLSGELGITLSRGSDVDVCWTVTYLMKYIILCMKTRSSESALIDDVLRLFSGLVDTKERYISLFCLLLCCVCSQSVNLIVASLRGRCLEIVISVAVVDYCSCTIIICREYTAGSLYIV